MRSAFLPAILGTLLSAVSALAGAPFSAYPGYAPGPYAPQINRYSVVDPVPPTLANPSKHGASPTLWTKRDAAPPAYPYGWFGVRHGTERWSHTRYYDDAVDVRILRSH
jgi:hypothetical protein